MCAKVFLQQLSCCARERDRVRGQRGGGGVIAPVTEYLVTRMTQHTSAYASHTFVLEKQVYLA